MTIEQIEQAATERLPHTEEIAAQDRYALGKNVGYKRGFISGARNSSTITTVLKQ